MKKVYLALILVFTLITIGSLSLFYLKAEKAKVKTGQIRSKTNLRQTQPIITSGYMPDNLQRALTTILQSYEKAEEYAKKLGVNIRLADRSLLIQPTVSIHIDTDSLATVKYSVCYPQVVMDAQTFPWEGRKKPEDWYKELTEGQNRSRPKAQQLITHEDLALNYT